MKAIIPIILYSILITTGARASVPIEQESDQDRVNALRGRIALAQKAEKLPLLNELTSILFEVDMRQAESINQEALELAKRITDQTQIGFAWLWNAQIQFERSRFAQALAAVTEAEARFAGTKNKDGLFLCHYHRGRTALAMDDYERALASLQNVLRMEEMFPAHSTEAILSHIKLAILYNRLQDRPSAQKTVDQGICLAREMRDWKHLGYLYNQAAIIAGEKDDFSGEIALYEKAKACFERIGDRFETLLIEHNMGVLYKNTDRLEAAIRHLDMARRGFRDLNRHTEVFQAEINLGQAYAALSRHSEAGRCFETAIASLEKQNLSNQYWAATAFAEYCEQIGNHREAARYYRMAAILNESLFQETREKQIGLLRESFEAEKREQKILLLEKDQRISHISRNLLGFILLSVVLFLALMMKKVVRWLAFWKKHQQIGQYQIISTIATGGMGTVYKGHPLNSRNTVVALKVLKEGADQNPSLIKRFKREGEMIDRLDHPNIVRILERGTWQDRPYIVMEYLAGETLDSILKKKLPPLLASLQIMMQTADAVKEMHARRIVHCDIKAQNIMICNDPLLEKPLVKILDFGLAKVGNHTRLTTVGILMGTMTHTAPELFHYADPSAAADIYALGVVFYHLLTGALPFKTDSEALLLEQILNAEPARPSKKRPDTPPEIDSLIAAMMSKTPDQRPSADHVVQVISGCINLYGNDQQS